MFTYTRGVSAFAQCNHKTRDPKERFGSMRVVFDPSGSFKTGALFTDQEVRVGVDFGVWESGIVFERVRSRRLVTWTPERGFYTPGARPNRVHLRMVPTKTAPATEG